MDVLNTARAGMMAAASRLDASAQRIARMAGDDGVDPVIETVVHIEAKLAFTANVQVVKFADEMWRSLLEMQSR